MLGRAGDDAETASPAPQAVARLVALEPGLFLFRLAGDAGSQNQAGSRMLPAVQVSPAPDGDGALEITDALGQNSPWLGGDRTWLFVAAPAGGLVLVTGYLPADAPDAQLAVDIMQANAVAPPLRLVLRPGPDAAEAPLEPLGIDVVLHIQRRGDVRFDNAAWVGRLGSGFAIEGFVVLPHTEAGATAIEYKGLSATGAETPWIGAGELCGSRGQGIPLLGFAVRQKTGVGGGLLDCEYAGYFGSGATAGPVRNGAPCRSPVDGDPLEGLLLRITPRPPRSVATTTAARGAVRRG